MIEPRAQRAELFHGRFVRTGNVDQQRIGGGAEGNFLHLFQQPGHIRSRHRATAARRVRPHPAGTLRRGRRQRARSVRRGAAHHVLDSFIFSSELLQTLVT